MCRREKCHHRPLQGRPPDLILFFFCLLFFFSAFLARCMALWFIHTGQLPFAFFGAVFIGISFMSERRIQQACLLRGQDTYLQNSVLSKNFYNFETLLADRLQMFYLGSGGRGRRGEDRKSTRLNSSHMSESRMPSSA